MQKPAFGGQSIATGSAAFLLIILQRARQLGVDHVPHVGLVDSHSKGDRGNQGLDSIVQQRFLRRSPIDIAHPRVIRQGAISQAVEVIAELFDFLPRDGVDDAG